MSRIVKRIRALFNPNMFHGWGRRKSYFEGWYYKLISADQKHALAIIPGLAMDENAKRQSFIQVLDGNNFTADYIPFPGESFKASPKHFNVSIDENKFQANGISLNTSLISGKLTFHDSVPWPSQWYSPGIMGPFSFVPFMECYHGILSMNHRIGGTLNYNGKKIDFSGGKGYMEKDWGHSFPSAYFWMQSNHFKTPNTSIKASVAKIPWLGSSFVGFIAGVYLNGELYQFTTYNQTKLLNSFADKDKVELIMQNRRLRLEISAFRHDTTELASPIHGFMDGRINESMTSEIHVKLLERKTNKVLLNETGKNAGLEVAGNINEIFVVSD